MERIVNIDATRLCAHAKCQAHVFSIHKSADESSLKIFRKIKQSVHYKMRQDWLIFVIFSKPILSHSLQQYTEKYVFFTNYFKNLNYLEKLVLNLISDNLFVAHIVTNVI